MTFKRLFLTIAFLAAYQFAFSQFWSTLDSAIPAPHVAFGDAFGTSISVDGNVAIIGAPGNDDYNSNAGKAFIFEKIGGSWVKQVELLPSHAMENINFGSSVLISGDYAFVGAPGLSIGATARGGVYIFKKESGSWNEFQVISTNDMIGFAFFGTSLAKHGNLLAVGVPGANGAVASSGAAYIFEFDGLLFQFKKKVIRKNGAIGEQFGQSIALNDANLFVGSPSWDPTHAYGAVFVFDQVNYDSVATLTLTTLDTFSFGSSISVTNNEVLISAHYLLNANGTYGAVCLFQKGAGWSSRHEDFRFTPQDPIQDYGFYGYALVLTDTMMIIGSRYGTNVDVIKKAVTGWGAATRIKTFHEPDLTDQSQYGGAVAVSATNLLIGASNLTRLAEGNGIVFAYESNLDWDTPTKLPDLNGKSINAGGDFFGSDVDISGNYAVVGAMRNPLQGENSGAAYVYQLNGTAWNLVAKLTPSNGAPQNYFGMSVSITGDRVVVSAPEAAFNGTNSGSVYVFEKPVAGWHDMTESAIINRVDLAKSGKFGLRVAAFEQEIALTHYDNSGTGHVGEVYVFVKSGNGWQLEARLNAQINANDQWDGFGSSLAFNGNTVVVGAPLAVVGRSGAVFVFEKPASGWSNKTQTAILFPSDPTIFGQFGTSVDIDQTTIIAGSPQVPAASGAAYIFEKGAQWQNSTENAILHSSVTTSGMGTGVAIAGNIAIASTPKNDGHVFLFRKENGQWKNTTQYNDLFSGTTPSQFGYNISLSSDNLIVGDPTANTNSGGGTGMVSFFIKDPSVVKVTSSTPDGTYFIGQNINVKVVFSHNVVVTGNPSIDLIMYDSTLRSGAFVGTGASGDVNFTYTVLENDSTPHLNYADSFSLNGTFTISSAVSGRPAATALPLPDSPLSLAGQKNIAIDGSPAVTGLDPKQNISVYPNPFEDKLTVDGENIRSYKIIDCTGTTVQTKPFSQGAIDTSQLTNGFYVLHIETRDGVVRAKIVRR